MKTWIALIRGINILGSRSLPMADLRSLCKDIGLVDPVTYIASGNVIFSSDTPAGKIEERIAASIENKFGYSVSVMVRDHPYFKRLVDENPFSDRDPKFLHATLLADDPDAGLLEAISDGDYGNDEFKKGNRAIYVYCPDGYGRTKLHNNFFEGKLKISATTRNWRTTNKLLQMAENR